MIGMSVTTQLYLHGLVFGIVDYRLNEKKKLARCRGVMSSHCVFVMNFKKATLIQDCLNADSCTPDKRKQLHNTRGLNASLD